MFLKKKRLLLFVDSKKYIKANCYQSQLFKTLDRNYRLTIVSADDIFNGVIPRRFQTDTALSVLRLRTLDSLAPRLGAILAGLPLFVYEQDPWQSFMDDSPYKGAYHRIASHIRIEAFLNTSLWWANHVSESGLPSIFVRMGMLPEYCKLGRVWSKRSINLGFQGTLHPHRKRFFDLLAGQGIHVSVLPSSPYRRFLKTLQNIQIYIHTEDAPWVIDGRVVPRNALWIKDTEAAARGCFSIRDHEDESAAYAIDDIPTIFTYQNVAEVPALVELIMSMAPSERDERMIEAVECMRMRNDWQTVIDAIERKKT
ncbi:MAG: hypothetical protein VW124_13290 [Paracoccaceae bacterium]